jgi:hypothetical protein
LRQALRIIGKGRFHGRFGGVSSAALANMEYPRLPAMATPFPEIAS